MIRWPGSTGSWSSSACIPADLPDHHHAVAATLDEPRIDLRHDVDAAVRDALSRRGAPRKKPLDAPLRRLGGVDTMNGPQAGAVLPEDEQVAAIAGHLGGLVVQHEDTAGRLL